MLIARHAPELKPLVHAKERVYYAMMFVASLLVYAGLVTYALSSPEGAASSLGIVAYAMTFALLFFMMHGLMLGRLRANGVRVGKRQFPELHALVLEHAKRIGMKSVPDVFVMESGGMLNAFATRFLGRDFVVVYSDVLALAEERGEPALGFIVAHELAHVARGHLRHRWLTLPGRLVPYLGAAYSRACEYTCDRFGAHCQPDGAVDGLLVLAAGPALYRRVDVREYARQVESEKGWWVKRAELMSTHPHLTKRVSALLGHGVPVPEYTPMQLDRPIHVAGHAPTH